jgi:hypothetical protein
MEFSWGQWLRGDLASWIAVVIVGITAVLAYKTWRSVLSVVQLRDVKGECVYDYLVRICSKGCV